MSCPLQCRLQERGQEGSPGSGGPQDGGEGPQWVREVDTGCVCCDVVI